MREKRWYSVGIGTEPTDPEILSEGAFEAFLDYLESDSAIGGPVGTYGSLTIGPGAQMSVRANDPVDALAIASESLQRSLERAGIGRLPIAHAEVLTEDYQDAMLAQPRPEYAGVAEVARILGVSKQRVYELRAREDFPKPVAELAAGPVWNRAALNHFIASWDRKPGPPVRALTDQEKWIIREHRRGVSAQDLAQAMGVSPAAARARIRRLLQKASNDVARAVSAAVEAVEHETAKRRDDERLSS